MINSLKEIIRYNLTELQIKELEEYLLELTRGMTEEQFQCNIAQLLTATILANKKILNHDT